MFSLRFNVNDEKLPDVLSFLAGLPVPLDSIEFVYLFRPPFGPTPKTSTPTSVKKVRKPKRHPVPGVSQYKMVSDIIAQRGPGAFKVAHLIDLAKKAHIGSASVYRALRNEILAGRIRKLSPGTYQRTSAGWTETLGLAG